MAEAGVTGVLKTFLFEIGDVKDTTDEGEKEEDAVTVEEIVVDLPTYDLSFATIPGYS